MRAGSFFVSGVAALTFLACAPPLRAVDAFTSDIELVQAVMPAFVDVYNRRISSVPDENNAVPPPVVPAIREEVSSGFIIDPSGIIATNRHVIENKMTHVDMINKAGKRASPTLAAFQAAAANADWTSAPGYYLILSNQPGDQSWPMTAATFILMYAEPQDKAASAEALKFFDWAFKQGDQAASELDYIPMPANVKDMVRKTWAMDIQNH